VYPEGSGMGDHFDINAGPAAHGHFGAETVAATPGVALSTATATIAAATTATAAATIAATTTATAAAAATATATTTTTTTMRLFLHTRTRRERCSKLNQMTSRIPYPEHKDGAVQ
jgi:hypothetical protein